MQTLTDALPWFGALFLVVGLVALARGAGAKTMLGTFPLGLTLLAFSGARQGDVLLVVGLALAGLAVILVLKSPEESSPDRERGPNDTPPPDSNA